MEQVLSMKFCHWNGIGFEDEFCHWNGMETDQEILWPRSDISFDHKNERLTMKIVDNFVRFGMP